MKKRPDPPAAKLMVLKMRVEAVEAGLMFMMRGDSVRVRRVGRESAFTFPSEVKERSRGELLSLPQSTAFTTTTEEVSGKAWVAICLWLGKAKTDAPWSVPTAKTSWSPWGAASVPSWLPVTRLDTFRFVAFTLSKSGLHMESRRVPKEAKEFKDQEQSSPLSQGKAGVEETELEDCGLESEQRAARRDDHALALPESREIIRQIKEIRELKTKHRKALLPICRSSSARGPPPNGMEDVTRTSFLMRKLAIFLFPAPR